MVCHTNNNSIISNCSHSVLAYRKEKPHPTPEMTLEPSHYAILNLPLPPTRLSRQEIKLAYHRALLRHHPDKSRSAAASSTLTPVLNVNNTGDVGRKGTSKSAYTVDQITLAYKVISDPVARAEYDRTLRMKNLGQIDPSSHGGEAGDSDSAFRTGLEVFDLDDMQIDDECDAASDGEHGSLWYRSCRCGDEKGFLVKEEELEREAERGEIVVGCRGCSLWAKIMFAVDED